MASSLSKRISLCSTTQEKTALYELYASDNDTALQVLLHIVGKGTSYYDTYKQSFQIVYTLRKYTFTKHKLSRIHSIAQGNGIALPFILHDIQAPIFRELMQKYGAKIDTLVDDAAFDSLSYFVSSLKAINQRNFLSQSGIEAYLQTSLSYHQKDLKKESFGILKQAQSQGYTKESFMTMKVPTHELMVEDGAVSLANKEAIALFQKRNAYRVYQAIQTTPYFLFVGSDTQSVFIGTHRYKQAILSYTSEQARELRFEDASNTTADLLIDQGVYKKIYIRGSDEDTSRWFDTSKQYEDQKDNYSVNTFFESESGLSEISHLMTSNQDLIFRSPTTGTALVEGVSGSGKTNLIFHRIDYLLQELPEQFQADQIMIFTPNDILAAYMQAALSATSFTFKDTTTIQSFGSILALPHPKESEYTSCDTTLLNQTLETVLSSIHTQYLASLGPLQTTLYDTITQASVQLQALHTTRTSLDQHVHKDGYTEDLALLDQASKNLKKVSTQAGNKPNTHIVAFTTAIDTALYTTYTSGTDSVSIKQRYHDELFEAVEKDIQSHIQAYQNRLLTDWIDTTHQEIKVNNYSQSFQDLLGRLTIKEQALMHQLMTVSLFQYVGKSVTYSPYQYVLIDEFQDFHPLALKLLGELYGNSMILSGDFMQSAWYHGVEDLKQLGVQLVDHRTMRDNFRNTLETIQYAHSVFGDQTDSLFLAKRVIKRGPHPEIINNGSARIHIINSLVSLLKPKETIAVIYYEFEYAKQFYTEYSSQTDQHILFPSLDAEHYQELVSGYYSQQLYFISYRESKGLEFDHVVLIDQQTLLDSALAYKKKLWYIGCTRAVKTLSVVR